MGKYCQHVLSAFSASANRPEVFCQIYFFCVNDTSYCLMLHELYQFTVNLTCSESAGSVGDSSFIDNRFCDFLFNTNLAEKQSASSDTSNYGHLPHFRKLSVFEFAVTLQSRSIINYFCLSRATVTFPVCVCALVCECVTDRTPWILFC